ncbi:7001_t:CDS:1 [Ambispora gerdemannii]|uniref:7001_t:CDS:1 n=1 Tax=Ambispora gerdemannii TaxID=144530 RepID=A0A9N9H3A4_9GLOM|nr:7001_t:CDS:1 [Ambispora gerdemannii]
MPHPTKCQKHSRKAYEAKVTHQYIKNVSINDNSKSYPNIDNASFHDELDDYVNVDSFSVHDEPVENDNAVSIIKKLQEAAKEYYQKHASHEARRLCYIGNSSHTKRRKNQQQCEATKETLTLHTFWDAKRSAEKVDKELADETNVKANNDIDR